MKRPQKPHQDISPAYKLGLRGEDLAAAYLEREGYKVLERRTRIAGVEIDIVARRGEVLVFAEVKTRASDAIAAPETAVDRKKQRRMITAADAYVRERDLSLEVRFDILSVVANPEREEIRHIEDAFMPFV